MVDNFDCAGYTFYSKFDSGNLGRVELVRCCEGLNIIGSNGANLSASSGNVVVSPATPNSPSSTVLQPTSGGGNSPFRPPTSSPPIQPGSLISPSAAAAGQQPPTASVSSSDSPPHGGSQLQNPTHNLHLYHQAASFVEVEFNLWTRPDCAGTPYENQNRTWFYFAVTGGRPNQIVKFNVMNLNKQAKLFSQGMHPVMKVGPTGRWERIKDKPSYAVTNDIFFISFLHRAPESADTKIFYAFTFPFTYNDLLDQLGNFDKRYGRHPFEMHSLAKELSQKFDCTSPAGPVELSTQYGHASFLSKKGKLVRGSKVERSSPESFDETARDGIGGIEEGTTTQPKVNDPGGSGKVAPPPDDTELVSVMSVDDNNTSESMQQITNLVNLVKIELPQQSQSSLAELGRMKLPLYQQVLITPTLDDEHKATNLDIRDDIYYYRELLTHSVERRRIELLTITSFHGIQATREERLQNLFPDDKTPRCHTFKHKKIIFISSRVHPGETPASFVLNGFLNMLLDRKSIVSITLRRMYVFKIIPFLNPDGVYNGLYRSDTRGQNLNRVYLAPIFDTQPAIYASRKLIRYHHLGTDEQASYETGNPIDSVAVAKNSDSSTEETMDKASPEEKVITTVKLGPESKPGPSKKDSESNEENNPSTSDSGFAETANLSSSSNNDMGSVTNSSKEASGGSISEGSGPDPAAKDTDLPGPTEETAQPSTQALSEPLVPEPNPVVASESSTPSTQVLRPSRSVSNLSTASSVANSAVTNAGIATPCIVSRKASIVAKVDSGRRTSSLKNVINKPNVISGGASTSSGGPKTKEFGLSSSNHQQLKQSTLQSQHSLGKAPSAGTMGAVVGTGKKGSVIGHPKRGENKSRPQTPQLYTRSHRNEFFNSTSQKSLNISMDYLAQLDDKIDKAMYEDRSNMFLYIDLHGHASKKGVFMYGNHLPNIVEAVECMLLPRLMSLNSLHFHYDACNFSERNMYYKGKRDGLSKEGSGRVAIYKSTGLIKSYTLECNYNTGKSVNVLPPKGKELPTTKVQSPVPPKYTPAVFEEVGRAMGPSILDLTNSNPQTRLHNSEFRTLHGLRNMLRLEIERGSSKARVTNKVSKSHSKRLSNQSSSSLEVAKENALQWENMTGSPGTGSGMVVTGSGGGSSPTGAGASGNIHGKIAGGTEPLGGNGNSSGCCPSASGGSRQFLKGGTSKTHSGKISRKGVNASGKSFGKKDALKKSKILCESGVGSTVVTGGKKLQELIRGKDQVPRKKIKVSPPHQHSSSAVDGFDLCFKTNLSATALPNFLATPPSLGELPLTSKKVKTEVKMLEECLNCDDSLDAIPCCSYSSHPTTTTSGTVALTKLISTYSQAGTSGPVDLMLPSSSASGVAITSLGSPGSSPPSVTGGGEIVTKGSKISKFSKATSAKQHAKLGKSSKSNDGGKLLKKKRSLKTDSNLKRKKTRVKPALT
ncbi:uncharacterized protein LOC129757387 isoform X2 [Uranotaenia lowii]|uniref:uncharacterized protein LOC129757387 isoform X2 n=1 Tax=Uranotaenia lowii TaxID=190385 RepID=UPI00247AD57E|nr:uncharacterized protein LOC129757387 isoform X2 [Uranotaenia lowii]